MYIVCGVILKINLHAVLSCRVIPDCGYFLALATGTLSPQGRELFSEAPGLP